ncbi:MFS transporter [Paracoccus jeotgali]|nr:MFS transporter [Paracoccus jeotgali]
MLTNARPRPGRIGFILLMVLVGLNLRPALSSLAPLLPRIEREGELSVLMLSSLTTLPVVCLGLFAPLALWLAKRLGMERSIALGLTILSVGLILRGVATAPALFAGTLLAGAAIAIVGTLLPALVMRELAGSADLVTGVYTMALCLGGALGAGLSIPLADLMESWPASLMSWAGLSLAALLAWWLAMPQSAPDRKLRVAKGNTLSMLRQPLAWQVMVMMGSQSSLAYIVFGWLPTLLVARGYSEGEAGWLMSVSILTQLVSAIGAPWLARMHRDQRPMLMLVVGLVAAGLWVLLIGPSALRWPGSLLLGLGQGGLFSLALTLIVLRSGSPAIAGELSVLAQGGGYLMAALGPLLVGLLLHADASIARITYALFAILSVTATMALLAGRKLRLELDGDEGLVTVNQRF